ncbi:BatA domain-containing protein [Dokdonia donghaensis]|uniref:Aerotolerance regulator N-terminal domain-containing protein n=1 Tax=Dokdonia donghaensis DSW-1 TaxID=1300343 RepID=A0A0A2GYL2_9FLAO|nr:BatA domain-containing protein [Dokdonia donghaensis]ANH60373.1 hypothetical protein I597_1461 [Dokdonia donghaensis DSW-1]KGO07648.1 hypothetical protein NV36_12905 [Dokdonia donghaensis DSW-1]
MTLLQPTYLWGLLGLLIPIAIHLWSKRKVKTIQVGSTQFITETKSKQSNSIQINEWWLLLLRCLLITILTIILAQPYTTHTPDPLAVAYIFEPSLIDTQEEQSRFKTLPLEDRFLLKEGLPKWDLETEIPPTKIIPSYWQLAQEIGSLRADSVVVFSQNLVQGIQGKRPSFGKHINWVSITSQEEKEVPFYAIQDQDIITVLSAVGRSDYHAFAKAKKAASQFVVKDGTISITQNDTERLIPVVKQDTIAVDVIYNSSFATEAMYLESALRAVKGYTRKPIAINVYKGLKNVADPAPDYLIWLSNKEAPEVDIPVLKFEEDLFSNKIVKTISGTNYTNLTQRLSPEVVINKRLVEGVLHWLSLDAAVQRDFDRLDNRSLAMSQFKPNMDESSSIPSKEVKASLVDPLWLLLIVMIIIERVIAKHRKQ